MKKLTNRIYENLTVQERFAATVSAIGRNDEAEVERLKGSISQRSYRIGAISARINDLITFGLAVDLDLHQEMANWLLAHPFDGLNEESDKQICQQVIQISFKNAASVIVARDNCLEKLGISREEYDAFNQPKSPLLEDFIQRVQGEEDPDLVKEFEEGYTNFFENRYQSAA